MQPRIHRVGHQHRVINGGYGNIKTGKNLGVILHVLPDFQDRRILKHRFQHRQTLFQIHLALGKIIRPEQIIRRRGFMGQRDITGLPRLDTQRDANKIGNHLVQAGGFGIHRHIATFTNTVDPDLKGRRIAHAFIGVRVKANLFRCRHFGRGWGRGLDHGGFNAQLFSNAFRDRAELHFAKKAQENLWIRIAHFQIIKTKVQRHVAIKLHELLGHLNLRAVLDQRFAPLGLFDLTRTVQQAFQITVFIDQKCRCLDPDPRRTRHIVHAITGQSLYVDHAVGAHAELLNDTVTVDTFVLHRVKHFDTVANQLHQVLIRRYDCDTSTGIAGLMGEGRDNVVGLEPFHLFASDIECLGRHAGQWNLRAQILWHRFAVRFVLVVHIVAERMAALVENHGHMGGGIITIVPVNIALQHVHKATDSPHWKAIGFARQGWQRVIGAENKRRAVNQMQVTAFAEFRFHRFIPSCLRRTCATIWMIVPVTIHLKASLSAKNGTV